MAFRLRKIWLVAIFAAILVSLAVYFHVSKGTKGNTSKDFELESLVDRLFRRCFQKNIKFQDLAETTGQVQNCLNANQLKPDIGDYDYESLDEDLHFDKDKAHFGDTAVLGPILVQTVREAISVPCKLWSKASLCVNPLLHILENCFNRLGSLTEVFELLQKLSCIYPQGTKLPPSKATKPAFLSWSCPKLISIPDLLEVIDHCISHVRMHRAYFSSVWNQLLCNDVEYEEAIRCSVGQTALLCTGKELETTIYQLLMHTEVKSFIQAEFLECA